MFNVNDFLLLFIIVSCTLLIFFFMLKLFAGGKIIANRTEVLLQMIMAFCIILWAAAQLMDPNKLAFQYLAFNLVVIFLSLYIKVLGERLEHEVTYKYLFYGVIIFSALNMLIMSIVGSENILWQYSSVLGSDLLVIVNAAIIYRIKRKKLSLFYRVIPMFMSLGLLSFASFYVLYMVYSTPSFRHLYLLGATSLVVVFFLYCMDQVYFYSTRDLSERINSLREEYAAEMEMVEDVVISLARTIDAKDRYTEGHTERVSQYSIFLAERLGLNDKRLGIVRMGALIHDIGKIGIDQDVLNKPGGLNEEERLHIETHPLMGAQICAPLKSFKEVEAIIRNHHEKLDGSGYPDGLTGDQISLETRIVTIADIFDALTTERSYRPALSVDKAIRIMHQEAIDGKLDGILILEFEGMLHDLGLLPGS